MNQTINDEIRNRALAAFLGLALGDALGATVEFLTPGEIRSRYKRHCKIRGGGWLHLKPGQVTDDTEMSLALGRALLAAGGWSLQAIAEQFLLWMRGKPIDIGSTVRKGIRLYQLHGTLEVPPNEWDAGNGGVMRLLPVVLAHLGSPDLLCVRAVAQARLTHHHPLSDAACRTVALMTHDALLGGDRFELHARTRELVRDHSNFRFNNYQGHAGGYVVETLQTVFHYLFTTAGFEECLVGVVNQGGDADTTGAIAGMIAGAFYGLEALPGKWLKKLDQKIRREIEQMVPELLRLASPEGWTCTRAEKPSRPASQ